MLLLSCQHIGVTENRAGYLCTTLLLIKIDSIYLIFYVNNFNVQKISGMNGNTAKPNNGIENKGHMYS